MASSRHCLRPSNEYLLHSMFREDTVVMFLITIGLLLVGVGTVWILVVVVVTTCRISVVLIFGTFYITGII